MCPLCAVSISTWLLAGGTGGAAAITSGIFYQKCQNRKKISVADKPEITQKVSTNKSASVR